MSTDYRYFPALSIPGGAIGQVLTKSSNDLDNGAQWLDPATGIGPTGPAGPAGPVGPAGAAGTPGATGATGPGLKSFRATGTTNGSGLVTFNLTAASFASAPVVVAQYQGATNGVSLSITAISATSVTVFAQTEFLVALNWTPEVGATVHLIAMPSGSQV